MPVGPFTDQWPDGCNGVVPRVLRRAHPRPESRGAVMERYATITSLGLTTQATNNLYIEYRLATMFPALFGEEELFIKQPVVEQRRTLAQLAAAAAGQS